MAEKRVFLTGDFNPDCGAVVFDRRAARQLTREAPRRLESEIKTDSFDVSPAASRPYRRAGGPSALIQGTALRP
jgi:hypothetical protein